mmetsp:Transcript_12944/g.27669  ORF Transcript_12944/g.27669 Transcript_12944/m.27669 type:complete len:85 (+) Transcript_12944:258-512(+)
MANTRSRSSALSTCCCPRLRKWCSMTQEKKLRLGYNLFKKGMCVGKYLRSFNRLKQPLVASTVFPIVFKIIIQRFGVTSLPRAA